MAEAKQIQIENWNEYLSLFSKFNQGRLTSIALLDNEIGDNKLAEDLPLIATDYDPIRKGNDMIISLCNKFSTFGYAINAPVELWERQNNDGVVISLEIIDLNNNKAILIFN